MRQYPTDYHVHVLLEPMTLYRACFGRDEPTVEDGLRSNYEIRKEPPHPADLYATVLHMAVSMFENPDTITRLARGRPDRIGTHIAQVALQPEHGVCVANTGSTGHWSVWGLPAQLLQFVTDVQEVH